MVRTMAVTITAGFMFPAVGAAQENHVTLDSEAGQLVIKTGYTPGEEAFWIDSEGWMRQGEEILVRESFSPWPGDVLTGWQAGAETVLSSDWFAATGRLDGGDFYYEIAGLEDLNGSRVSDFAWAQNINGELVQYGLASANTRVGRSFHVGFSGHPHGQLWLAEKPGLYALTLVAWDANGVYADSDPVRFHIRAVPTPGSMAVLGTAGLLASRRRRGATRCKVSKMRRQGTTTLEGPACS